MAVYLGWVHSGRPGGTLKKNIYTKGTMTLNPHLGDAFRVRVLFTTIPNIPVCECNVRVERSKLTLHGIHNEWSYIISYLDIWRLRTKITNDHRTLLLTRDHSTPDTLQIGGPNAMHCLAKMSRACKVIHLEIYIDVLDAKPDGAETCPICIEPCDGEEDTVAKLPCCGSLMHTSCLLVCWRSSAPCCPMCRSTECVVCLHKSRHESPVERGHVVSV